MTLSLSYYSPVPTVSWSRGGSSISAGGRVQLLQWARQLQISGVEPSDAGTYTCTAAQGSEMELTATGVVLVIGGSVWAWLCMDMLVVSIMGVWS